MSVTTQLTEVIRNEITSGILAPGTRLTEVSLAKQHGVSRTPARAALKVLATEGLVTVERNRGAVVSQWTSEDSAEVMRLRTLLEPHGAELGALYRNDEQLNALNDLCTEMENVFEKKPSGFRSKLGELNRLVHLKLLETAHSPRLYSMTSDLLQMPMMSSSFQLYRPGNISRSLRDHREVLDAIASGDAPRARAHMEAHMRNAYATLRQSEAPGIKS